MKRISRAAGLIGLILLLAGFYSGYVKFRSVSVAGAVDELENTGFYALPAGKGPFPAVVIVPDCGGLNPEIKRDWAPMLAAAGYVAIAFENQSIRDTRSCLLQAPFPRSFQSRIGDAYGALDYLSKMPEVDINRVAVMGFSHGGGVLSKHMADTFKTPAGHRFKAMISLYALCNASPPPDAPAIPAVPWLIIKGSEERRETKETCAGLKGRENVTFELIEGAHHGWDIRRFTTPHTDAAGNVTIFSKDATNRSQVLVRGFLARHLQ